MAVILANQLNSLDTLAFDNIVFFRRLPVTRVTDHPVEGGSDVSDHTQKMPDTLVFRGRITATPLGVGVPGRLERGVSWFERNEGKLISVTAPRGIFSNVIVTRWDHGDQGLQELLFDVTMRQVIIAFGVSVPIPPRLPNPVAEVGSASPTDAGVQPPTSTPPPASTSFASSISSFLGF